MSAPQLRSMEATLAGYAWLPRMLDKARGTLAGDERPEFGCPVDHTCMARLGVGPDLVLDLARRHDDDQAVLGALREHGIPAPEQAFFDAVAVEDEVQAGGYLRVRERDDLLEINGGRAFTGAEHGASVSVLLIDSGPGEVQPAHAHEIEEVIFVSAGEATVFLGELQARTLRAGQVGRVPAEMVHRLVNRGEGRLAAVAVQGAPEIAFAAAE